MAAPQSVVIVEDECIAAEDIRRRLVSWGYSVPAVVATGEDAIQSAERVHPDVVLMDIHLKGRMDGVEAAERIRARLNVPVIYATAYNDSETMSRAGISGPFEMVNKPYDDIEIRAAIELALTRQRLERRLSELEQRHRSLLTMLSKASQLACASTSDRGPAVDHEGVAGWVASEVDVPLNMLRRHVGSLHATELSSEQRSILDNVEHSLRSLETLMDQIQQ
jgi:CheY-like chemotaxis protein